MIETFAYIALNAQGRKVHGTISADGVFSVVDHLRARDLAAVTVEPIRPSVGRWLRDRRSGNLAAALVLFYRSLSLLLESGVQLRRALHITVEEIVSPLLSETVTAVIATLDSGQSLGAAMRMHPNVFSPQAVALIDAGEQAGALPNTLSRYAETLAKQHSLMRKIGSAMIYPAFVLTAAFTLIIGIMVSLLPTMANLFVQMNVPLPDIMRAGIGLSAWWSAGGWITTLGGSVLGIIALRYSATKVSPAQFDALRLSIPIFGRLFRHTIVARFARLLSTLLGAGVSIVPALHTSIPALQSPLYALEVERLATALEDGGTIADALRVGRGFDSFVVHLVAIGEETGKLEMNLARIAEVYERDVEDDLAAAVALIEPVVILIVGAIVGLLVFSVFVPLYSLIGNIR